MSGKINILTYKVKMGNFEAETDGSAEEHSRVMELAKAFEEVMRTDLARVPAEPAPVRPIRLKEGCESYINTRAQGVSTSQISAWRTHFKSILKDVASTPEAMAHTITPEQVSRALFLMSETKHPKTVEGYLDSWRRLYEWLIKNGHAIHNPAAKWDGYSKRERGRLAEKFNRERLPWDAENLKKWYDPVHLNKLDDPAEIWCPIIGLYTGARLESISCLCIQDFKEYAPGKWSVHFAKEFDKMGRERDIPLHQDIINAGLLDYISDIQKTFGKEARLFPHLRQYQGKYSRYLSKDLGRRRSTAKIRTGMDIHSLRTTLVTLLSMNDCPSEPKRAFVGHEHEVELDIHDKNYNKSVYGPEGLEDRVMPFIDFSKMGFVWSGWRYKTGSGPAMIRRQKSDELYNKKIKK